MIISRKSLISLLACIMLACLLAFGIHIGKRSSTYAASSSSSTDVHHYFYNQLADGDTQKSALRKKFYEAMEKMYNDKIFIGGGDLDLTANGFITQSQLEMFSETEIVKMMGAARDAFYTDYAEIFYVDFDYLSLRVTTDNTGKYHAYLGSGRADTYYTQGFKSSLDVQNAITKYENARDKVVEEALAAKPTEEQVNAYGQEVANKVAQIQYAHSWIAENTIYKLEATATPGNEGHVRTPYGVFVAKHDDGTKAQDPSGLGKFLDGNQGEALCEGYSRAFKAVMDKLGVPCVLVNGVYRHGENQEELHMWCYIELDGEWYAVDQTFDDLNRRSGATGVLLTGLGNAYSEDYFLKGYSLMNTQHATSRYKSEAEYAFTYPQLAYHNLGSVVSTTFGADIEEGKEISNGMIKVTQHAYDATLKSTTIEVSVFCEQTDDKEYGLGTGKGEWCGYKKAAEEYGLYIVVRYEGNYLPEQIMRAGGDLSGAEDYGKDSPLNGNGLMRWSYVNSVPGASGFVVESEDHTLIKDISHPYGFEFAITTVPPREEYDPDDKFGYTDPDKIAEMFAFLGDPTMFVSRTGFIETLYAGDKDEYSNPFIAKATPTPLGKLAIGRSYDVTVEYDQYLKLMDGAEKLEIFVYGMRANGEFVKGTNAIVLEKVVDLSTLTWDRGEGNNTNFIRGGRVSFKFTPSPEYAHDNVMYYFNFNLVGENSGKQVNSAAFCAGYESDAMCYKANGFHWSVYAQPQLVESGDLSTEGWKTSDGYDLSDTKSRLALVVTSPSKKQESQMNDLLEHALDTNQGDVEDGGFESFTYNISLTICKGVSIETGQGVRIGIGFPEGFTYDDSMDGVMFEAYHFIRDAQNNVVEVEKLEVTVTPLGLIILVKSFSPFAIVVRQGEALETTDKTVIVTTTSGGSAHVDLSEEELKEGKQTNNMFKVAEGSSRTLKINAKEGYAVESVKVNGKKVEVSGTELELKYNELDVQNIIEVNFVSENVKAAEESRGEHIVIKEFKQAEIVVAETEKTLSLNAGKEIKIEPTVKVYGDINIYQWYKDGVALSDQTDATLFIKNAKTSDSGEYTLKITSISGVTPIVAESAAIKITVTDPPKPVTGLIIVGVVAGLLVVALLITIVVCVKKPKSKKRA